MTDTESILQIDPQDNVFVALKDVSPGTYSWYGHQFVIEEVIPKKHKFVTQDLQKNDQVIMYGVPVGLALYPLKKGALLTTENVVHFAPKPSLTATEYTWKSPDVNSWKSRTFMGYRRQNGNVGTANYWLFVPLVFCENRNLKVLEETLIKGLGYKRENQYDGYLRSILNATSEASDNAPQNQVFENVDGIKFLYHHGGCGGDRNDSETLLRLLAGYVNNPNVAGATILSLGCQHAQIDWYKEIEQSLYPEANKPIVFIEQQKEPSEEVLIQKAISETIAQLKKANEFKREPCPLSDLVIGTECGGSDGFSGLSANPAVGHVSDLIVSLGGTTVLSEFPELNGVEQNIVNRCSDPKRAEKFLAIQEAYEQRAQSVGSGFDKNPSPGNIKDGLITDAIKSAGAAKKGGKAPVSDVLDYTEPITQRGLNLLCTPGNDVESTTGMAGSGCNIILFTTGLGTPTGNPVAPVIKISSNTELFQRMTDLIDVDAGKVISGQASIEDVAEEILEEIIAVASGKKTKAMILDQNDFIPWKRGVSL